MPIEITRRWSSSRLRQIPGNWEADESFDVTGVTSKQAAIDAVANEWPTHWDNKDMRIVNPQAEMLSAGQAFRVSATYNFRGGLGPGSGNPLDEPTYVSGDFESVPIDVDTDVDGNAIVNSAGDPIENLGDEETVFVLVLERNIPFFSIAQGVRFTNAVNSNAFVLPGQGGVSAGQALCRVYRPVGTYPVGASFVRVQAVMAFRSGAEPWQLYVKDQGRNTWYSDSGNKRGHIVAENGDEAGFDVSLDGTGKPISSSWKALKDPKSLTTSSPIANPSAPSGLFVDTTRSTSLAKILRWRRRRRENFGDLPF